jgi:hypothetical protein
MTSSDRILSIIPHDYEYAQWIETESASAKEISEVILQCTMRQNFFRLWNQKAGTDLQRHHLCRTQSLGPTLLELPPHSHQDHDQRSLDPQLSEPRSSR